MAVGEIEGIWEKQLCPDCFRKTLMNGICNSCGFERAKEKTSNMRLPEFFVIQERYCIGKILGAGGFGITYKAYDTWNHSYCAIKEYVPNEIVSSREPGTTMLSLKSQNVQEDFEHGKERFLNEAQLLKRMNYLDEVVHITDYFLENNTAYFVMEYLDGVTISELMKVYGGRIPLQDALHILKKTGTILQQVHDSIQIFHRDISTQNIMVLGADRVKLIDFGNAKYLTGKATQTLSVILKKGYAPPEQYSSVSKQGSYTDVYALAATFYYMVSGMMIPEAMARTMEQETYPALKELGLGVSPQISDAVDHALRVNPRIRTQTVNEFLDEIGINGRREPYMEILNGTEKGRYRLPRHAAVRLGRSGHGVDIRLQDSDKISNFHCELFYDDLEDKFYLVDHSRNGTYIGEKRLVKEEITVLEQGVTVTLGNKIYLFRIGVEG